MTSFLCISVRFLQPNAHGRDDNGDPEWPPSPLRVLQALVAASAGRWNERRKLNHADAAIRWLESLPPPQIVAADAVPFTVPHRLYVPDNVTDKVAAVWARNREASISKYRVEKDVRPMYLSEDSVHYLYRLANDRCPHLEVLTAAARSITQLGWGIDIVVGNACVVSDEQAGQLSGVQWHPAPYGGTPLRVHRSGTLDDLVRKHADFLDRVTDKGFHPVAPLRVFDVVRYRRQDEPLGRPWRVFELRNADGSRFRYSHCRLIHIAGMVRHLAVELMKNDPPRAVAENWLETYVAGHAKTDSNDHRQLSYLPLPSVGHEHTDPGVRRIMIVAPVGDDAWLDHVVRRLAGLVLKPEPGLPNPFPGGEPPILVPMPRRTRNGVVRCYTEPANVWHSFTPVILPGHDDHKSDKTWTLIERSLHQSGIDQACEFEWSAFSRFSKSYSAHKYDRQKRPQGYLRPSYLNSLTAVHLTLRFKNDLHVPGPLVIGAGRHCGFGLMAHFHQANEDE
jgi:CRISPR-associated protein Csb2